MKMTVRSRAGAVDVVLATPTGARVEALVGALASQGLAAPGDLVRVAGRDLDPAAPLDRGLLHDGAVVEVVGTGQPATGASGDDPVAVHVAIVGGLDAGRWLPLAPGRHRVGRGADAVLRDRGAAERHATLDVAASGRVVLADHARRGATTVDGDVPPRRSALAPGAFLRAGGTLATVVDRLPADAPRDVGAPFDRPPRPGLPPPPPPPDLPPAVDAPTAAGAGGAPLASVLSGLLVGGLLWRTTGHATYALLALAAPLVAVAGSLGRRRRHRRERARSRRERSGALDRLAEQVAAAGEAVARRQRAAHPDLAEVVRRATAPSTRLWERRPWQPDAGHLVLGHATVPWDVPVASQGAVAPDVEAVLARHAWLREVPVVAPGGVVGVVGPRPAALAVARSLLAQACVHRGPADLRVALVTPDEVAWDAAKWLPHLQDPATGRPRAATPASAATVLADHPPARAASAPGDEGRADPGDAPFAGPALLLVLDGPEAWRGPDAPARALLARRGAAAVVVASGVDELPASCDTIVVLEGDQGCARVVRPGRGEALGDVLATGASPATLERVARALAPRRDPEASAGEGLPGRVSLAELLARDGAGAPNEDTTPCSAAAVAERWARQRRDPRLRTVLGTGPAGPVVVDLAADGPHALVAGTTGAGKSELLRTLVAGLAAGADPEHVSFVLVDYKGGAAFDRCADLPHVAGLVTDLDEDLAERALACLRAELRRREQLLRRAGASDLASYRRSAAAPGPRRAHEPLPALVVVVDEFAALATELPGFVPSLVGVAQRGRSLGMHLVLATQRPAGVVDDHLRANVDLRIALRLQAVADAADVVGDPRAARLPRDVPGRALLRRGPEDLVELQTALATGPTRVEQAACRITPFGLLPSAGDGGARPDAGPGGEGDTAGALPGDGGRTELDALVDATREVARREGLRPPHRPWPPPLPRCLDLDELAAMARPDDGTGRAPGEDPDGPVLVALADEPWHQRRVPAGWSPSDGGLLLVGAPGSGRTGALASLALRAAAARRPGRLHVSVVVGAGRGLAPLAGLPHVAAVVRGDEHERLGRLLDRLGEDVVRRRAGGTGPCHLLLVDDWDALAGAAAASRAAADLLDRLARLVAEGGGVGVVPVVSAGRPGALPAAVRAALVARWAFRLVEEGDAALLGVPRTGALVPGRCVEAASGRHLQVARVRDLDAAVVAVARRWVDAPPGDLPAPVDVLPTSVPADVLSPATTAAGVVVLPVGVRGDDLAPAGLRLHPGEHALVAGPPRSGRSTALAAVAAAAARGGLEVVVVAGGAHRRSVPWPAGTRVEPDVLPAVLRRPAEAPRLVLVDDADEVEVAGLDEAVRAAGQHVHVVAAVRADAVRSRWRHWCREALRPRAGLLLAPDVDLDGDLLGVRLPRRGTAPPAAGRGWLVEDGTAVQCQAATPAGAVAGLA